MGSAKESDTRATGGQDSTRLREELGLYKSLVEDVNDAIFRLDAEGVVLFISPVIERLTGYTPAELVGRNFRQFVFPPDLAAVEAAWTAVAEGKPYPIEYRIRRKDGRTRWVRSSGRGIWEKNALGGIQGIIVDLSVERGVEDRVAKRLSELTAHTPPEKDPTIAEALNIDALQSLMERLHDATGIQAGVLDTNGQVLLATGWQDVCMRYHRRHPEMRKRCLENDIELGASAVEEGWIEYKCRNGLYDVALPICLKERRVGTFVIGQFFYEDDPPDEAFFRRQAELYGFDTDEYLEAVRRVPQYSREQIRNIQRFYEAFVTHLSEAGTRKLAQVRMIQDLETAQQAVKQSEERFRAMFDHMDCGVAILEPADEGLDFLILDVNPAGLAASRQQKGRIVGQRVSETFPGANELGLLNVMRTVYHTGEPVKLPPLRYRSAHIDRYAQAFITRLPYNELMVVFNDMTDQIRERRERQELETQLRQAQKMETVGRLAGGVAHDFNNILQAIAGYTELALEYPDDPENVSGNLKQVSRAAGRAATLVRQLLAFSKSQALKLEYIDMNELIPELLAMVRRTIGAHIELQFEPAAEIGTVYADATQIEQILLNLCLNARDVMPQGGRLTIQTNHITLGTPTDTAPLDALPGDYACLRVSDTGPGMDEETMAHAFEPFFTTKGVGEGSGLGLATVYAIAQRHDGFARIQCPKAGGTTVQVCLPLREAPQTAPHPSRPSRPQLPKGARQTVLLAEDDEMVRTLGQRILERGNYNVLVAEDGKQAENLFRKHADLVDIAVLDVMMPGRSGRQVHDAIKETHPHIPVIFASGYSHEVLQPEHAPPGSYQLLRKPFRPTELLDRVYKTLNDDIY